MKKLSFFFAMAVSIIAFATQPEPPVYYTGNNELAASTGAVTPASVGARHDLPELQTATPASSVGSVGARHDLPEPSVYYTGNNEPAASSVGSGQLAVGSNAPESPVYYTGNNEPAAVGCFIAE